MRGQGVGQRKGRTAFIVAFLSPAVLLYAVFVCIPLVQAFQLSLYSFRGVSTRRTYEGLKNFERLADDQAYRTSIGNNLWLLAFSAVAVIGLGLLLAHAAQGNSRSARALRTVYLFPQVVSMVVVAIIWQFLYNPAYGLVDAGFKAVGLPLPKDGFLGDPKTALPAVAIAFVWYVLGFYIMLFAAGIKNIPEDVFEAAHLDGADGWRRFVRITWPLLWSVKRVAFSYVAINVLNIFALVYVMTGGGPDRATETMLTFLYEQGFKNFQFGYASAVAVANFVVAMTISLAVLWWFRRSPEEARA